MKLIKRKKDNIVIYAGDQYRLTIDGVICSEFIDPNTTPANAEQIEIDGGLPEYFTPGRYIWDDEWQLIGESPELPSIDDIKQTALARIKTVADVKYHKYRSKYPEVEKATFPEKRAEAKLVVADREISMSATPRLANLSDEDIEARAELAAGIIAKQQICDNLEKNTRAARKSIFAAATTEEVNELLEQFLATVEQ